MTVKPSLRRFATWLLRSAVRIAPSDTAEWGQAMLGEMDHVEGDWAALLWAIGGAGFLVRRAVLSIFIPGGKRDNGFIAEGFLFKEGSMRKPVLAGIGVCVLASVMFFLAPAFRQALQLSLEPWEDVLSRDGWRNRVARSDRQLEELARRAEQNRDAEGLAFVAARHDDVEKRAEFAEEAVHLNPKLTWIYAMVPIFRPKFPEADKYIAQLKQWDPQNALPYLMTAERIHFLEVVGHEVPYRWEPRNPAWQEAMATAFRSAKFDDYRDRLKELTGKVMLRYGLNDPYEAADEAFWAPLPRYAGGDSDRYAQYLLERGERLENRGDREDALEACWEVVRFGHMTYSGRGLYYSPYLREAYEHLGELSEREGKHGQAQFIAYLTNSLDQSEKKHTPPLRFHRGGVSRWNSFLVGASGLMVLFFGGALVLSTLILATRVRFLRLSAFRVSNMTAAFGLAGAIGLLISSALLYASYHPYAEILQRFIQVGDDSRLPELSDFLFHVSVPIGAEDSQNFEACFLYGVTIVCAATLVFALVAYLRSRVRSKRVVQA